MSWNELIAAVLTTLVAAALNWAFAYLKVQIDVATFNALVAAIVAALLALFGVQALKARGVRGIR